MDNKYNETAQTCYGIATSISLAMIVLIMVSCRVDLENALYFAFNFTKMYILTGIATLAVVIGVILDYKGDKEEEAS